MEIRYVKPYFSTLDVNFYPIVVGVPVENSAGQRTIAAVNRDPTIMTKITGWIAGIKARDDDLEFKGAEMEAIKQISSQIGVDLLTSFNNVFDQVANEFPVTEDQPQGSNSKGPAIYLRPERFAADLNPTGPKSVIFTAGVYSDAEMTKRSAYFELVFEDGESKRNRQARIIQLQQAVAEQQSYIDETNQNWASYSDEQKVQLKQYAEINIPNLNKEIQNLQSQTVGHLNDLIGTSDPETSLQLGVKSTVVALCASILTMAKQTIPDYADIDVQQIMQEFAIPSVE